VQGTLLAAAISPDNTPHGYNLTFAFPMLMFIIIAGVLYLRFRSSHRVPGHVALASARWPKAQPAAESTTSGSTLHEGAATDGQDSDGPAAGAQAESTEDSE
jgi:hypothetical protein